MKQVNKYFGYVIGLLIVFFFLISMLALSFVFAMKGEAVGGITYFFIKYHIELMILLGLIGIGVGASAYYTLLAQQKDVVQTQQSSKDILLRFFDDAEKIIINKLLKKDTLQSELSRDKNLGKVKTFRTLQRLEAKGLVTLTAQGKTHLVQLTKEIKEIIQ